MLFASSRRLLALGVVALTLSVVAIVKTAVAQEGAVEPLQEATITIVGRGVVSAEPDIALIVAGAVTQSTTARAALDANSKVMNDAFAALEALGVEERDLRTSGLSIEPQFTYFDSVNGERRPPRIDGYTVSNQLTVRVRDLASLGDILDQLITTGVNDLGGLTFGIDDPSAHLNMARRAAITDASEQARLMADAAGVTLGRIVSITTQTSRPSMPQPTIARMAMAAEANSVPIASGEQEISASVTVTWALQNGGM